MIFSNKIDLFWTTTLFLLNMRKCQPIVLSQQVDRDTEEVLNEFNYLSGNSSSGDDSVDSIKVQML